MLPRAFGIIIPRLVSSAQLLSRWSGAHSEVSADTPPSLYVTKNGPSCGKTLIKRSETFSMSRTALTPPTGGCGGTASRRNSLCGLGRPSPIEFLHVLMAAQQQPTSVPAGPARLEIRRDRSRNGECRYFSNQ